MALPGTEDCVVIVEHPNESSQLMRVRADGRVVWRISATSQFESYVDLAIKEGRLVAWSWTGYRLTVDPNSGSILEKIFVK